LASTGNEKSAFRKQILQDLATTERNCITIQTTNVKSKMLNKIAELFIAVCFDDISDSDKLHYKCVQDNDNLAEFLISTGHCPHNLHSQHLMRLSRQQQLHL